MTFKLSQRSITNLDGVHPDLVKVVHTVIEKTSTDFGVIYGVRTLEEQKELFEKIRKGGETDFELIGFSTDTDSGVQVVTSILRDPVKHTFSVVETSSSGTSCIIAIGKFEGDHTKQGPKL